MHYERDREETEGDREETERDREETERRQRETERRQRETERRQRGDREETEGDREETEGDREETERDRGGERGGLKKKHGRRHALLSKLSAVYRAVGEFYANPSSLMAQQGLSASK